MKRFILALSLLAGTAGVSAAQTAAKAGSEVSNAEQERLQFISNISELDASLSRNRPEIAQTVLGRLSSAMQSHTSATGKRAAAATDASTKAELQGRAAQQGAIMAEVKTLAADPLKNRAELNAKLKDYLKNF